MLKLIKYIKEIKQNEEGINSIFLTIIITSLILLIFTFIDITRMYSSKNNIDETALIGINHILSFYCSELYNEYHLLGVCYQNDYEIEDEIVNNMRNNINFTKMNRITIDSVKIIDGIKLNDINEVQRQISSYVVNKTGVDLANVTLDLIFGDTPDINHIYNERVVPISEEEYDEIEDYISLDNRDEISNKINKEEKLDIVYGDDIEQYQITFDDAKEESENLIEQIKDMFDLGKDNILTLYALETFDSLIYKHNDEREKIYDCEVEYLIGGDNSQNNNIKKVKNKILLMLFPDNFIEVTNDEDKVAEATLISEAVCGWWATEAGVTLMKNILLTSWAYDMSCDEYTSLIEGKSVELSFIDKELSYKNFLYIFLLIEDDEVLTERIIKLIDMNLKKYNLAFSMNSTYSNITIECKCMERNLFSTRFCMPKGYRLFTKYDFKEVVSYGY